MADERQCNECGGKLPADAPQGLCPQCLMKLGLPSEAGAERRAASEEQRAVPASSPGGFVPPEPQELAEKFPQLEILELLGQGGMGAVYKARQRQLDRLVALKILPPEVGKDPAFAERFSREARSLAKLNHPRIVSIFDFGHTVDGVYYFIMEFVDGTDLRRVIEGGQLDPAEALAIVPQICEALQYAHEEGLVHRDIKPENILLDKKGRVKIADFGLAKLLGKPATAYTLTQAGQRMGTPHYMAPEQIEGAHEVDHRADIYSLGVVFYEMLTGELPLGRFAPPSKKVHVDVRLDEIVLHTLEKEPELRYQQASEVKTDVEQISSTSRPPGPSAAPLVEMPPSRRGLRARSRLLVKLAVWTAVVVVGWLFPLYVSSHLFWLPWTGIERHERTLRAESGAYPDVRLRAARTLYRLGLRLIAKGAWTATAKIDLPDANDSTTLEFDAHREEWRWGRPPDVQTRSRIQGGISPQHVIEWMKNAGIDTSRPGVQEEAAELIRVVNDAASGIQPEGGYFTFLPSGPHVDIKIGPFTLVGPAASGFEGGSDLQGWHYLLIAGLFLAVWYPGLRIVVRRHRRRLAAAQEKEAGRRYQHANEVKTDVETITGQGRLATAAADHPQTAMKTPVYKQVSAPAVALFVAGLLTFAYAVALWWALLHEVHELHPSEGETQLYDRTELLLRVAVISGIPGAFIMVLGAVSMKRFQSRGLALAGAILTFVPFTRAWLITMPIGIWVLSVLAKAEVKAAFPAGRQQIEANGGIRESTIKAAGEGLIAIAGIALLMAVGIGLWLKFAAGGWDSSAAHSRQANLQVTLALMAAISAAYALFIGTAGILMRRVRGRLFALLSVVIAGVFVPAVLALNIIMEYNSMGKEWMVLIPLWLGMPICLWAAAVLCRRDVRAMFPGKPDVKAGFPGGRRHSEVNGDLEPVQKQTDQTDTDERTDQMNTNSKSNIGTMSLVLAIGGTVLSIAGALLLALIESLTNFMPPYTLCFVLFVALEIAALVTGIIGRRSACGKAGLIISAILLLLSSIALPVSRVSWGPSEVGRFGDTSQNDNE